MKYSYGKEDLKTWLKENIDTLMERQTFQALIVEVKVADDANNVFVNRAGHDEVGENGRIETKFTNYIMPSGCLRLNSAGENKRDGFDFMRVIDGINERIFEVPHDEWYKRGKFYGNEFRWSSSYNKTDGLQWGNTQLLLDYEITK
jgi:hypothetical protein